MPSPVDNRLVLNTKRYQLIIKIQDFIKEGCSKREISRRLGISRNTVSKYESGDPKELSYSGIKFEPQPYMRNKTTALKNKTGSVGEKYDFITRNGVFRYLWMNGELTDEHKTYIFEQYPIMYKIKQCIDEFRHVFKNKNVPMLYLFIERYSNTEIKELASFANGLDKDIDTIENAVAYDLSNGFVEGTNSKLKMVKRTMYGRCKLELLSAKMMLAPIAQNDS